MAIELHPITDDNVNAVFDLKVAPGQEALLPPMPALSHTLLPDMKSPGHERS